MAARNRDDNIYREIGSQIEKLRGEKNLTQAQLAEKIGLTRTSIVHIEQGNQKLPIDRLYFIADALQVSLFDLLPQSRSSALIDPVSKETVSNDAVKTVEAILNKKRGLQ